MLRFESRFTEPARTLLVVLLARVGEDHDRPVFVFILEFLDEIHQVRVFDFLGCKDVSLIEFFHCSHSGERREEITLCYKRSLFSLMVVQQQDSALLLPCPRFDSQAGI